MSFRAAPQSLLFYIAPYFERGWTLILAAGKLGQGPQARSLIHASVEQMPVGQLPMVPVGQPMVPVAQPMVPPIAAPVAPMVAPMVLPAAPMVQPAAQPALNAPTAQAPATTLGQELYERFEKDNRGFSDAELQELENYLRNLGDPRPVWGLVQKIFNIVQNQTAIDFDADQNSTDTGSKISHPTHELMTGVVPFSENGCTALLLGTKTLTRNKLRTVFMLGKRRFEAVWGVKSCSSR